MDKLESNRLLECSSQSAILTDINDADIASDPERQESRGDVSPVTQAVQSAEDTEDIMLKPAVPEVLKPQVVCSPRNTPYDAFAFGRGGLGELTSVTECQSMTCRGSAEPSPRDDMSITAISSPENPSALLDSKAIENPLTAREMPDEVAAGNAHQSQSSG